MRRDRDEIAMRSRRDRDEITPRSRRDCDEIAPRSRRDRDEIATRSRHADGAPCTLPPRCAEGAPNRESILELSRRLGFLTGEENRDMLDAHVRAAALVGSPFASGAQPFDFGAQERSTAAAPSPTCLSACPFSPHSRSGGAAP